ncbi:hypothetical protein HEB94_003073 [Actinopolymorpha pittospori]|uniref:Uncharacterized protein n=1 Tax=Actinopolymorpha pittospori TaxID=648752 RepID=A0A927RBM5_9ACTN|nr:hypothetical protein [Actinopolymorpha pittospori]
MIPALYAAIWVGAALIFAGLIGYVVGRSEDRRTQAAVAKDVAEVRARLDARDEAAEILQRVNAAPEPAPVPETPKPRNGLYLIRGGLQAVAFAMGGIALEMARRLRSRSIATGVAGTLVTTAGVTSLVLVTPPDTNDDLEAPESAPTARVTPGPERPEKAVGRSQSTPLDVAETEPLSRAPTPAPTVAARPTGPSTRTAEPTAPSSRPSPTAASEPTAPAAGPADSAGSVVASPRPVESSPEPTASATAEPDSPVSATPSPEPLHTPDPVAPPSSDPRSASPEPTRSPTKEATGKDGKDRDRRDKDRKDKDRKDNSDSGPHDRKGPTPGIARYLGALPDIESFLGRPE